MHNGLFIFFKNIILYNFYLGIKEFIYITIESIGRIKKRFKKIIKIIKTYS